MRFHYAPLLKLMHTAGRNEAKTTSTTVKDIK